MAGHSKWANIRFRKSAQDAKRSKVFTRHIREIVVLARMGGPDTESNARLRDAVNRALKSNMKRDTIDKAIARGAGTGGDKYFEIQYEGYGPKGTAVIVECMTDNKNRSVAEVRHAFSKHGGSLGVDGCVAYLFQRIGILLFPLESVDEEKLTEFAIDAGAEDISLSDSILEVVVAPQDLHRVYQLMLQEGFEADSIEIIVKPTIEISLADDDIEKVEHFIDALEELDDVQQVHTNAQFPDG